MKRKLVAVLVIAAAAAAWPQGAEACTGITLKAKDGAYVVARTIEWGGSNLNSRYVVVPRGYSQHSYTPQGTDGMEFTARYGYVGMAVEQEEFVAEGLNEAGLSAGLFYFPGYGRYEAFDASKKSSSIADLQLVPWILGSCATVEEVKAAVGKVHVVAVYPDASTVHWRFADASGRQLVLEIIDGEPIFYENELGVLTNSPGFEWQLTNLNNYVNLYPGAAPSQMLGALRLSPFGAGSGFLGIPGDITPPSRFVRAAFYQTSAPEQATAADAVTQCFHILNNFDIPIGIETDRGGKPTDIPSATQLVPWILGSCATVEEVKAAVGKVHVVAVYPDASTVHWRFADASGRQLVLEIIDGEPIFYENELGVLTNSPGFEWQLTNLNNYVNLYPGAAPSQMLGALRLSPFGAGSGFLGIPGDITPPSRFVRAAFYQTSAPEQATAADAVTQCFHILNNFDIPIGIETDRGGKPTDIPSATQWTAVTDVKNRVIYYRTMYDSNIRAFDLRSIDFAAISYRSEPLDKTAEQPVQFIRVR